MKDLFKQYVVAMKVTLKICDEKVKEITIHQINLKELMIEVYKIINGYAPRIMDKLFTFRENTRKLRNLPIILNKTVY